MPSVRGSPLSEALLLAERHLFQKRLNDLFQRLRQRQRPCVGTHIQGKKGQREKEI